MTATACPICGEPAHPDTRPFCSARHRDRDLLQWLGEGYRLPGGPVADDGLDKDHPSD